MFKILVKVFLNLTICIISRVCAVKSINARYFSVKFYLNCEYALIITKKRLVHDVLKPALQKPANFFVDMNHTDMLHSRNKTSEKDGENVGNEVKTFRCLDSKFILLRLNICECFILIAGYIINDRVKVALPQNTEIHLLLHMHSSL